MPQQQQLTDKDIAGDILSCVKHMSMGYMTAVLESQDPDLRETFKDYHDQCIDNQQRIFQIMQDNGWYKVPMILDETQQRQ